MKMDIPKFKGDPGESFMGCLERFENCRKVAKLPAEDWVQYLHGALEGKAQQAFQPIWRANRNMTYHEAVDTLKEMFERSEETAGRVSEKLYKLQKKDKESVQEYMDRMMKEGNNSGMLRYEHLQIITKKLSEVMPSQIYFKMKEKIELQPQAFIAEAIVIVEDHPQEKTLRKQISRKTMKKSESESDLESDGDSDDSDEDRQNKKKKKKGQGSELISLSRKMEKVMDAVRAAKRHEVEKLTDTLTDLRKQMEGMSINIMEMKRLP
ncbi:Paraneoplastic antigen-like protein 5 [Frankliniella fusca]|uniref:Paraneoplastic antigen-like protein 5 n=1 Tax=Frankliniella fusca TaxID=407009 RepID=A0AAE1GSH9_9NEOP|nr:Paraneoplastic antigen-like protein 5 [Frankliniella fusca]